jgi:hypothetical protein
MTEKTLNRADIQREREALKKRLADLDVAERVLDTLASGAPKAAERNIIRELVGEMGSIKSTILRAASDVLGTTAAEIAGGISAWKPGYPVTNVSPKLSLYGKVGLLKSENGRWFITEKGRKELENSKN